MHPLTITPLVKRGLPWVGGIDGTAGRTAVGQIGHTFIKGLQAYGRGIDFAAEIAYTWKTGRESVKTMDKVKAQTPTQGP
jgi:hypothetical protein